MEQNKSSTKTTCECDKKAKEEIKLLKEEIARLKQENEELKKFIGVTV